MIETKNPTLLNVTYVRPTKDNGNREVFEVIYKTEDGVVHKEEEPAEADIYIVKPEYRDYTYNKPQELISHMNKIRVPISKIRYKIAEEMGEEGQALIERAYRERNFKLLNQLYKWPYCYGCDFQPEYYFMKNWYEKYELGNPKLTKGFLDIETDLIDYALDMDNISSTAYSPVNLVTVILDDSLECKTFVLRPYKPSKIGRTQKEYDDRFKLYERQAKAHEHLMGHMDEFIKDLHDSFDGTYGHLDYQIREYEQEIELIADVFRLINNRKPNFCMIWNMRFDIQYMFYRIQTLGYDPVSIMCSKDFKEPRCYFKVDKSTFLMEKQFDYFFCSSYTQYICQMRLYASIRKSQHKLKSMKLNDIGDRELKDRKVEYPEASNIVRFAYDNWILFIKYNIKDVLLQYGIEKKTKDVMTYYTRSHSNMTPYNKIFRETHLLRNVREMYFEKDGWVQGNNLNIIDNNDEEIETTRKFYGIEDDEEESSFKGAINAEPGWNDYVGMEIYGHPSNNIHENAMDYDMGAFYPSIKIASNMDPGTLLYKASFINDEFMSGEFNNRSLNNKYSEKDKNGNIRKMDITGEAVNTYVSGNILTFAYNYLNLPSISSIAESVIRELS